MAGLVGIQRRDLLDVVAVEVVHARVQHVFAIRLSRGIVTCCRGNVAAGKVIRISRSFVVHEIMVTLRMANRVNLMSATIAVHFLHHWILAAYDLWVRFVAMVTIRLLNRSCLRTLRMIQTVVVLVMRRSRLRLLSWLPVVLLVAIAASTCMVFGRIFSLKIADYTTIDSKLSSAAMGRTISGPTGSSSELCIQIIQRTHSGDLGLIRIWIGRCHDIVVVIVNVNDCWISLPFFAKRDLCVTTARGRKLGIPEQVRSTTSDGGLCRVQPLNTVRSQTPPANVIHDVRVNVIDIVRYTIACIGFELSRSEFNGLAIVYVTTVVVNVTIVTTAIVGTEGASCIE